MRTNERSNRDPDTREQYAIFEFIRFGMLAFVSIIGIGIFMRVVFN